MHEQRLAAAAVGGAVCAGLALALLLLPGPASASGPYQIVGTATSRIGPLVRTETTVQVGADPLDRFRFYRLVHDGPAGGRVGSILLLPPLGPGYSAAQREVLGDRGAHADRGIPLLVEDSRVCPPAAVRRASSTARR